MIDHSDSACRTMTDKLPHSITQSSYANSEKLKAASDPPTTSAKTSSPASPSSLLSFPPHIAPSPKVVHELQSDASSGLTQAEAERRLEQYGPNRLRPPKRPSPLKIVVRQVGNAMSVVLSEWQGMDHRPWEEAN